MGAAEEPVHLAGAILGEHRHICAFFNNAAEEYRLETYLHELRERRMARQAESSDPG
jgi:hypothetical protein